MLKNSNKGNVFEVDVEYLKNLHNLDDDLSFLQNKNENQKMQQTLCNLYVKKSYVIHIRTLKQVLKHGLVFINVHTVLQFNQEA